MDRRVQRGPLAAAARPHSAPACEAAARLWRRLRERRITIATCRGLAAPLAVPGRQLHIQLCRSGRRTIEHVESAAVRRAAAAARHAASGDAGYAHAAPLA